MTEPIRFIGAFESTFQPEFDVDVAETTGHVERWRADIDLVRETGVTELRYPIRWHRVEAERGSFDWRATDEALDYIRESGLRPIVDLLHHTSYPLWLDGFADPAFGPSFLRYVLAFAERYPWVPAYTIFNEPFTTFFLTGHEGIWEPHYRNLEGFVTVANNVMPAPPPARPPLPRAPARRTACPRRGLRAPHGDRPWRERCRRVCERPPLPAHRPLPRAPDRREPAVRQRCPRSRRRAAPGAGAGLDRRARC